jgi:hypothetical protein
VLVRFALLSQPAQFIVIKSADDKHALNIDKTTFTKICNQQQTRDWYEYSLL